MAIAKQNTRSRCTPGGLITLLIPLLLSIYKPRGRIGFGKYPRNASE